MAADNAETLEGGQGGLPLVRLQGLNTNQAVNFSGFQVSTGGNPSLGAGGTYSGSVTGPTGSFNALNLQGVAVGTGGTGSTATLAAAGASAGGPSAAGQQTGWLKIYVAGSPVFIPTFT